MRIKEKKERALGEHLYLKGERCSSPKCAVVRRPYPPGAHGKSKRRKALSDFGRQIKEKQKFKATYGVDDRNLMRLFRARKSGKIEVSASLIRALESRLDSVVFRLGFAKSRSAARQLITHGHILVNAKKVRSPGYEMKIGNVIGVRAESREFFAFKSIVEHIKQYEVPAWLDLDKGKLEGKVVREPDSTDTPFDVGLLVESFSK